MRIAQLKFAESNKVGGRLRAELLRTVASPCLAKLIDQLIRQRQTGNASPWLRTGKKGWSGRRDSNPRLRPWQGRTLPLSYSRSLSHSIALAHFVTIYCTRIGTP